MPLINAGKLWTKDNYSQLAELYNSGKPLKEICLAMGRSPAAIIGKLCEMGALVMMRDGNYYPVGETPYWYWRDTKPLDEEIKGEANAADNQSRQQTS